MELKEVVRVTKVTYELWQRSFGTENKLKYTKSPEQTVKEATSDIQMQELALIILRSKGGMNWINQNQF